MRDPYEVLGVSRNASEDEIKSAFFTMLYKNKRQGILLLLIGKLYRASHRGFRGTFRCTFFCANLRTLCRCILFFCACRRIRFHGIGHGTRRNQQTKDHSQHRHAHPGLVIIGNSADSRFQSAAAKCGCSNLCFEFHNALLIKQCRINSRGDAFAVQHPLVAGLFTIPPCPGKAQPYHRVKPIQTAQHPPPGRNPEIPGFIVHQFVGHCSLQSLSG